MVTDFGDLDTDDLCLPVSPQQLRDRSFLSEFLDELETEGTGIREVGSNNPALQNLPQQQRNRSLSSDSLADEEEKEAGKAAVNNHDLPVPSQQRRNRSPQCEFSTEEEGADVGEVGRNNPALTTQHFPSSLSQFFTSWTEAEGTEIEVGGVNPSFPVPQQQRSRCLSSNFMAEEVGSDNPAFPVPQQQRSRCLSSDFMAESEGTALGEVDRNDLALTTQYPSRDSSQFSNFSAESEGTDGGELSADNEDLPEPTRPQRNRSLFTNHVAEGTQVVEVDRDSLPPSVPSRHLGNRRIYISSVLTRIAEAEDGSRGSADSPQSTNPSSAWETATGHVGRMLTRSSFANGRNLCCFSLPQ